MSKIDTKEYQFGTGDLICIKCGKIHKESTDDRKEDSALRQSEQLGGKISNTQKDYEKRPIKKVSKKLGETQKFVKQDEYDILIHRMLAGLDKKFLKIGGERVFDEGKKEHVDSPESAIYSESYKYIKKFKNINSLKLKETKIKVCATYYLVARRHGRIITMQEISDSILTRDFSADITPTTKNRNICQKYFKMSDIEIKKMPFTNRQLVRYLKMYFKAKKKDDKKIMRKMEKNIKSGHIPAEDIRNEERKKSKRKQTRQKNESTPYLKTSKLIQKHFPALNPYSPEGKNNKKSNEINKFVSVISFEPNLARKLRLKVESKYEKIKAESEFASKSQKGIIATLIYLSIKELEKKGLEFSFKTQKEICGMCDNVHPTTMTTNIKAFKNIKF